MSKKSAWVDFLNFMQPTHTAEIFIRFAGILGTNIAWLFCVVRIIFVSEIFKEAK
jgi:hypothetical protein